MQSMGLEQEMLGARRTRSKWKWLCRAAAINTRFFSRATVLLAARFVRLSAAAHALNACRTIGDEVE